MNVNCYILVYIHSLDFIDFIATYLFPSKMTIKVYIQNTVNKKIKTHINKKEYSIDKQLTQRKNKSDI